MRVGLLRNLRSRCAGVEITPQGLSACERRMEMRSSYGEVRSAHYVRSSCSVPAESGANLGHNQPYRTGNRTAVGQLGAPDLAELRPGMWGLGRRELL